MYQFITGPLLWLSLAIFVVGLIVRVVLYVRGLDWKLDRVPYGHFTSYGIKGAARSIFYWIIPFGTHNWRQKPGLTILTFTFHLGLVFTPLFLLAHAILLKERWGIGWPTWPGPVAEVMTIAVIVAGTCLVLRRIAYGEIRVMSTAYDYLLMAIALAPFITGYLAGHGAPGYRFWLMAHILSGEVMLVAIPFTKLSHMVLFFCSRAQLGMDYGIKRGGMKGRGLAW